MNRKRIDGKWLTVYEKPSVLNPYGVHFAYATKTGGPVPKVGTRWSKFKNIHGFYLNSPWLHAWFIFRRHF